jgi:hypothetical protein
MRILTLLSWRCLVLTRSGRNVSLLQTYNADTTSTFSALSAVLGDNVLATNPQSQLSSIKTASKSSKLSAEVLARHWRISLKSARRTLQTTTQRAVRDWSQVSGDQLFRPTQFQLRYPRLKTKFHVDVYKGPIKSLDGNTCLAVYTTPFQWVRAYGLRKESEVETSLQRVFREFCFPEAIIPDDAPSLTQGDFFRTAQQAQVPIHAVESYMYNQRLAEDAIREVSHLYE